MGRETPHQFEVEADVIVIDQAQVGQTGGEGNAHAQDGTRLRHGNLGHHDLGGITLEPTPIHGLVGAIGQDERQKAVEALAQFLIIGAEGDRGGHRQDGLAQQSNNGVGSEEVRGVGGDDESGIHLTPLQGGDKIGISRQVSHLCLGIGAGQILILNGAGEGGNSTPRQIIERAPATWGRTGCRLGGSDVPLGVILAGAPASGINRCRRDLSIFHVQGEGSGQVFSEPGPPSFRSCRVPKKQPWLDAPG